MRNIRARLVLATALALAPLSLAAQEQAEVIHYWTTESESRAVKVFADAFAAAGGAWIDNAIAGGNAARQAALTRIVAGDPPTASQFIASTQFEDLVSQGLLAPVADPATTDAWLKVMPSALTDIAMRNGSFYALPLNIHGISWIWYDVKALEALGVSAPTGWDEDMFAAMDAAKAAGKIPFAMAGQPNFELPVFHSIMLYTGGSELWDGAYREGSEEALMGDKMRATFETFARLREYSDPGAPGRTWNAAIQMIVRGEAVFASMGDWAKGEFKANGWQPGVDFGCTLPGGILSIGGDVFVFPVQPTDAKRQAQAALLQVLTDPVVLRDFAIAKDAIPPRTDVDMAGADICTQAGETALKSPETALPRLSLLKSSSVVGEIQDLVSEFWNTPSMTVDEAMERHAQIVIDG